jgi:nucleoside-diphosphate-sugar epimerase
MTMILPIRRLLLLPLVAVSGFSPLPRSTQKSPRANVSSSQLQASALIVQNKGGGHGELGFQLAQVLADRYGAKIDSITLLQDDACKDNEEPFQSYGTLPANVRVIKAPLGKSSFDATALQSVLGGADTRFDYVFDNASKGPEGAGKACADCAKNWGVALYVYVSSAGMYKPQPNGPFPMPETTKIKESAGQAQFDKYCVDLGLPLVSFRPQYIYGEKANKHDYMYVTIRGYGHFASLLTALPTARACHSDYFFDRLVRDLPVPIPGDGQQLVSLTNSKDVARLLAAPLDNPAAAIAQRFFNCGTDQLVSYDDVVHLCAKVAEKTDYNIEHYDAELFAASPSNFPFRDTNFYVAPDTAKAKLGWEGAMNSLEKDLPAYFENYKARGGPTKYIFLMKDWEIVVGHKTPSNLDYVGSIYDKYDPLIIEDMEPGEEYVEGSEPEVDITQYFDGIIQP